MITELSNAFNPTDFLRELFAIAVATADPMRVIPKILPEKPRGRVVVIGAGKASARMAEAVESLWGACEGLVITRYGYARPTKGVKIVEAAHPVPDESGVSATKDILRLLDGLGENDFVLALISGGASALLCAPSEGLTLSQKQVMNSYLLASGAPIGEMNIVRKHLSAVKGGQLAARAYPAKMLSLMISDVPGDDPAMIGSGSTVGDVCSWRQAIDILNKYNIPITDEISQAIQNSGVVSTGDARLSKVENKVIIAPSQSLDAAARHAKAAGFDAVLLGDAIEGEARDVAKVHADFALKSQAKRKAPFVIFSGGEVTVTKQGEGVGGPNAEYALALALALDGAEGIYAIACDTDGVDGAAEVAGAVIDPETLSRVKARDIDAQTALDENDAHGFFAAIGGQVITGPTLTNVNDFRAILVYPAATKPDRNGQ